MDIKALLQKIIDNNGSCNGVCIKGCPLMGEIREDYSTTTSCFESIVGDRYAEGNYDKMYLEAAKRKLLEITIDEYLDDD